MHIYQAIITLWQPHKTTAEKEYSYCLFYFKLIKNAVTLIFWLDNLDARNLG